MKIKQINAHTYTYTPQIVVEIKYERGYNQSIAKFITILILERVYFVTSEKYEKISIKENNGTTNNKQQ